MKQISIKNLLKEKKKCFGKYEIGRKYVFSAWFFDIIRVQYDKIKDR